ncbi:MAG: hypothetical protein P1P82_01930 [Bacteroidales bacterium]|nr:hypothetical protein [Bacteroidales bacterium]
MKKIIFALLVLAALPLQGQRFFLQLQPEAGVSSFTSGIIPYELRSSYQVTLAWGLQLNDRSAVRLGFGVQQSGARSTIIYAAGGVTTRDILYQDVYFIKVPVDYSISLGSRGLFTLDAGAYYNLNITDQVVDMEINDGYLPLYAEDYTKDDVGLRLRPAVSIPFSPKVSLSLGILQEFGLVTFLRQTHHYNTYLSAGMQVQL